MIKKLLISAFAFATALGASAYDGSGTYTLYSNGTVNPEIGSHFYGWYNAAIAYDAANPTVDGQQVLEFKAADGSANASCGWQMEAPQNTGNLHSATLNFKYYATSTGNYTIRLKSQQDEDCKFEVTAADVNQWKEVSWPVEEKYPVTAAAWNENKTGGVGYVFSVVLENGTGGSIYFDDVKYTNVDENWVEPVKEIVVPKTVPTPAHDKDKVLSFFSAYGDNVNFNFQNWGAPTVTQRESIDGKDVLHLSNYTYLGFDGFLLDISDYDYMHVDYFSHDGKEFGFTPISRNPQAEKSIKHTDIIADQWNGFDVALEDFTGLNFSEIYQLKVDGGNFDDIYIANIYFWKKDNAGEEPGGEEPEQPGEKGATYHGTATGTFTGAEGDPEFTMTYTATWNDNGTVTFNATITPNVVGLVPQMFANGAHIGNFQDLGNNNYTFTTGDSYEAGTKPFAFFAAYAGGDTGQIALDYVVGSSNQSGEEPGGEDPEEPDQPKTGVTFTASVDDSDTLEDKEYPYTLNYSVTYNDDKTLTVDANVEWGANGTITGSVNWNAYFPDGNFEGNLANGPYKTEKTYEAGQEVKINFWTARAMGRTETQITYIVGSSNEGNRIEIKATVDNITAQSAEIAYEVTAPEGAEYKVYYKTAETEAVEANENPIKLTDLNEKTEYAYELYAVMTGVDENIESRHVTVTFKTPAANASKHVFNDYLKAEFKNAYRVGEDESLRRSIYASVPFTIVYDLDETAVYSIDLGQVADIVGLNPQIYWNGFRSLIQKEGTDIWEFNFGKQELDAEVAISHYLAYNGGTIDINLKNDKVYSAWGQEKEEFELGAPVALTFAASKNVVKVDEAVILSAVATDSDGYYLPADEVEYTVEGGPYTLDGVVLRLIEKKGQRTVTATMGDFSNSVVVNAMTSPEATDLISGIEGVTDMENVIENTVVGNVTDNNPGTELRWGCSETQEHYLIYDLGIEGRYVEAIDLLFEGAWATEFTVTLSNTAPDELGNGISTMAVAEQDVVFSPSKEDTQHYFVQDPEGTHRYVTLRTTKARDAGWGIKVKDMKVYGTTQQPTVTGVDSVTVVENNTDAPVEYYNLQGVRVENPGNGLYIRRQGNTATKVLIK